MEKKGLKRLIILGVCIILVLLIMFLVWKKSNQTTIVPLGETIVLDSEKEEEDAKKWKLSNAYMHEGIMEMAVTNVEVFETPKEAGIDDIYLTSKMNEEDGQNAFLMITYTLHNIDAVPWGSQGFSSTMFQLVPYHLVDRDVELPDIDVSPDSVYSSVFKENVEKNSKILDQPKEGYYFQMEKGETMEIQSGFYIDEAAYKNGQLMLALYTGNEGQIKTALEIMD